MKFLTSPEGDPVAGLKDLPAYALRILGAWAAHPALTLLAGREPGASFGTKIFFQLAGHNRLRAGGKDLRLPPGHMGVVLKNSPHGETWDRDGRGHYLHLFVGLEPHRLAVNLAGLGGIRGLPETGRVFGSASLPFAETVLMDQLLRFAAGLPSVPPDLCATVARVLREGMRPPAEPGASDLVARAVEAIRRNPCHPDLSVKGLAQELDCHPDYLSRRFAAERGEALMRFVRERRMEVAADLMRGMRMPVAEVATLCGYRDHSYFTKVFRECRGVTPSVFMEGSGRQGRSSENPGWNAKP